MKINLLVLSIMFSINLNAQDTKQCESSMSINKLRTALSLQDLVPQLPKDCMQIKYTISIMENDILCEMRCNGYLLSEEVKKRLGLLTNAKKILIEQIKSPCFEPSKYGCLSMDGNNDYFVVKIIN